MDVFLNRFWCDLIPVEEIIKWMAGRSYKSYKIALTHSKLSYNYIDFSILKSP